MSKPEPTFGEDELLIAVVRTFEDVELGDSGVFTTREIAERTGMDTRRVRTMLHRLQNEGRLEVTRTPRRTLAGVVRKVEAYRLKPPSS